MPDIFQQRRADGTLVTDLAPVDFSPWYLLRDSFKYTAGQKDRVLSRQPASVGGGSRVLRENRNNDTVGAQWVCVGNSEDNVWWNMRQLISAFEIQSIPGVADLRLFWLPDGVVEERGATFVQVGSADWDQDYHWVQLKGGLCIVVNATWQIRPYDWYLPS